MIKILLAEDHTIVRNGIRSILESDPRFRVIGEAKNGQEVIQKISEGLIPDLVIADINMPEVDGLKLIEELNHLYPAIKTLILSMLEHEKYIVKAICGGAAGYLLKNTSKSELLFAIQHIQEGNQYICSELSLKMLAKLPPADDSPSEELKTVASLSKREKEILGLIAEGYTNSEIADMLFTSRRTVEGHRLNLIEKTGVRNTAALIKFAVKTGIIE